MDVLIKAVLELSGFTTAMQITLNDGGQYIVMELMYMEDNVAKQTF